MITTKKRGRKQGAKTKWREYLKGEYQIEDLNFENKMRFEIRRRARNMIRDLLLISEKASKEDRIRIFHEGFCNMCRQKLLLVKLMHNMSSVIPEFMDTEEVEEIRHLTYLLIKYQVSHDLVRLVEDKEYRERKRIQLYSKTTVKTSPHATQVNASKNPLL